MASLYLRKNSPYIWIRWYDKNEQDPKKRRMSASTKLPNTPKGWKEARELKRKIEAGLVEKEILRKSGVKIYKSPTFTEGLIKYIDSKELAFKTKKVYGNIAKHLVESIGNKAISEIKESDFNKLITYLKTKGISKTSLAIYSRHLSALWNYFVSQQWTDKNIIKKISAEKKSVVVIPKSEMEIILNHFQQKNKEQYYLVKFLLLTGMRISSALHQEWQEIDWENDVMTVTNIKAKNRKYFFPLHPELKSLLEEIGIQRKGRIFSEWNDYPKFWRNNMIELMKENKISRRYTIHDLRRTFTSWLINAGVDQSILMKLLDHSDIRITDESYSKYEMKLLKKQFKKVKF